MTKHTPYVVDRIQQYVDCSLRALRMRDTVIEVLPDYPKENSWTETNNFGSGSQWGSVQFTRSFFSLSPIIQQKIICEILLGFHFYHQKMAAKDLKSFFRPAEWSIWESHYNRLHSLAKERVAAFTAQLLPPIPDFFGPGWKKPFFPEFQTAEFKAAVKRYPPPKEKLECPVGDRILHYIFACLDSLKIFDYGVDLVTTLIPESDHQAASMTPVNGRQYTHIRIGVPFFELTPWQQRSTIAHELIHLLFAQEISLVDGTAPNILTEREAKIHYAHYNQFHELAVDRLAETIDDLLPIPPDFLAIEKKETLNV